MMGPVGSLGGAKTMPAQQTPAQSMRAMSSPAQTAPAGGSVSDLVDRNPGNGAGMIQRGPAMNTGSGSGNMSQLLSTTPPQSAGARFSADLGR